MLSARAGDEAKVEGLDAGADDYLTKPFSARELLARVRPISRWRGSARGGGSSTASEAQAREQAERVQLALDAGAIIGTWVWDVRGDRLSPMSASRAPSAFARRAAGRVRAGGGWLVMRTTSEVAAEIAEALLRGGAYRCDIAFGSMTGSYRWIEANGRVDQDPERGGAAVSRSADRCDHRRAIETALAR